MCDSPGPIRQIVTTALGHEKPTVVTNHLTMSASTVVECFAIPWLRDERLRVLFR